MLTILEHELNNNKEKYTKKQNDKNEMKKWYKRLPRP